MDGTPNPRIKKSHLRCRSFVSFARRNVRCMLNVATCRKKRATAIAPTSARPRDPRRQSERRAATFTPPPTRACPSSSFRCADGTPHDLTPPDDDTTTNLPARGPTARCGPRAGRDDVRVATAVRTRSPDHRVVALPRDRPSRRVRPPRDPGRGARRAATHRARVVDRSNTTRTRRCAPRPDVAR
jgi:hypothetical protein